MQDCHSRIAQVECQGQTRYTLILDCKPFINTYDSTGHRLELKFFLSAQLLLIGPQKAFLPQKSENRDFEI